jgi:hypothetical protein
MEDILMPPDTIWDIFPKTETYELFKAAYVPDIYLNPLIDASVVTDFKLIAKTIELSYFAYVLLELARHKAFVGFESALGKRYKELKQVEKLPSLEKMVDWFFDNGYFETDNNEFLHRIRKLRNCHAHGQMSWPGFPPGNTGWIFQIMHCINDLYEDRILRKERLALAAALEEYLEKFKYPVWVAADGGCIIFNELQYLFYNNKLAPPKLTVGLAGINMTLKDDDGLPGIALSYYEFENVLYDDVKHEIQLKEYDKATTIRIVECDNDAFIKMIEAGTQMLNPATGDFWVKYSRVQSELLQKTMALQAEFYRILQMNTD